MLVAITDMRSVDLARYPFDFDLTFAALLVHPDGHVYHRYGGRDVRSADRWLSEKSWIRLLETTLEEHERYEASSTKMTPPEPLYLEKVPAYARRDKGECVHCHSINEALHDQARDEKRFDLDDIWVHPEPAVIGLDLDRDEQRRITSVDPDTPAAEAGLQVGDLLLTIGATPIASASDVMHALDATPMSGGELVVRYRREERTDTVNLRLREGWKRGTPYSFSWRASKWGLEPVPGFGGPALDQAERQRLEIPEESFAFRVQYMVTWGHRQRFGRAAGRAGLRNGDVVLSLAGKSDFRTVAHFHAWWRLTREVGEVVPIHVLRDGERVTIELKVIE